MPFTPVHFGLGALPGGYPSRYFSFRTFCFANVAIDTEVLYRIPFGLYPYHDWMHTFLVGTVVPLALLFPVGVPFCLWISRCWNQLAKGSSLSWVKIPESIATLPALTGVVVGSVTHVFLDSIMHGDMSPLRPLSDANPFLGWIGVGTLHALLFGAGLLGLLLYGVRMAKIRRSV